jgi:hypothetical protein
MYYIFKVLYLNISHEFILTILYYYKIQFKRYRDIHIDISTLRRSTLLGNLCQIVHRLFTQNDLCTKRFPDCVRSFHWYVK